MKRVLLTLESALTFLPFMLSWLVCAIGFAIKAGYHMAQADRADKAKILDAYWKPPK